MPAYTWTCSACGHANAAGSEACATCRCAAVAKYREIAAARERYEAAGGVVLPGAAKFWDAEDQRVLEGAVTTMIYALLTFVGLGS